MKTFIMAAGVAVAIASSSGCCLIDKLFCQGFCGNCCNNCGPYPGCGVSGDPNSCVAPCGGDGCAPGACCNQACCNCPPCGRGCCGPGGPDDGAAYAGPPSAAVSYPYYTTRAPRDFLDRNPRPIGP